MIELTDRLRQELVHHAEEARPQEACGLISRGDGGVVILNPVENAAEDPEHGFKIGAENLRGILKQIDARGEKLIGVYHSHPGGEIAPSPDDVKTAMLWPGLTWIIVGNQQCPTCHGEGEISAHEAMITCLRCEGACAIPVFWTGVLA